MLFDYSYDIVGFKETEELKACLFFHFGLDHIVHIMFKKIECTESTSLKLELFKAHGDVFIPDFVGSYVVFQAYNIKKTSFRARTVCKTTDFGMLVKQIFVVERSVFVLLYMICVGDLLESDSFVMVRTDWTSGVAAGIYEEFAFLFVRNTA